MKMIEIGPIETNANYNSQNTYIFFLVVAAKKWELK